MKDNAQELKDLLLEFGTFLKKYDDDEWGDRLLNMIDYVDVDLKEAKRIIRTSWYAGMGSFNDVGIDDKDGVPLREVNNKFDYYSNKLYSLVELGS